MGSDGLDDDDIDLDGIEGIDDLLEDGMPMHFDKPMDNGVDDDLIM